MVPLEVAATGPRVIEAAARHADRICFAVGANVDHLATPAPPAATPRRCAMAPSSIVVSSTTTSRSPAAPSAARWQASRASRRCRAAGSPRSRRRYDMQVYERVDADHTAGVDDAFVDWFALAGPAERVLPRFVALA